MTLRERLEELFDNLKEDEIIELINEYVQLNRYGELIHYMEDFDDEARGYTPTELLNVCEYVDLTDDYFYLDDLGDFRTFSDIYDAPITPEDLMDYIEESEDSLGNKDIEELLDEFLEDEDEDE